MSARVFFFAFLVLLAPRAEAHPLDLASMSVKVVWLQIQISIKLRHTTADRLVSGTKAATLEELRRPLFDAVLGSNAPLLRESVCEWEEPALIQTEDHEVVDLRVQAQCEPNESKPLTFELELPFLKSQSSDFRVVAAIEGVGLRATMIANSKSPRLFRNASDELGFGNFITMGASHIGVTPEQWFENGKPRLPNGFDHICFVLAILLAGGTLLELLKSVSGFTIGHSLTLGLATFEVIHFHSYLIEAFIALSIAVVAGLALIRPRTPHRWVIAALFGLVHGLGFAAALHDLELPRDQLLSALLGAA